MHIDIHKVAGIIIQDRKLLVTRSQGKDIFVAPGGKLEANETPERALVRELKEELSIDVDIHTIEKLNTYFATPAGHLDKKLQMDVFFVLKWVGEITPQSEIAELQWVTSALQEIELGSIFQYEVIPELKQRNLII